MDRIVQKAIKNLVSEGETLVTPKRESPFIVKFFNDLGIVLLIGKKKTSTILLWECLEEAYEFLKRKEWVEIGTKFDVDGIPNSFDGYFRKYFDRAVGSWVAAVFEKAGLVVIDRRTPNRIRAK